MPRTECLSETWPLVTVLVYIYVNLYLDELGLTVGTPRPPEKSRAARERYVNPHRMSSLKSHLALIRVRFWSRNVPRGHAMDVPHSSIQTYVSAAGRLCLQLSVMR